MLKITYRIVVFLLVMLTTGCAAGNFGSNSRNNDVDRIFRSGSMPTEYRYYYYGWETEPTAIMGIRKDLTLRSKYWHEVAITAQQTQKWRKFFIQSIGWYDDRKHGPLRFAGYSLFDPQGREVGIVYSQYDWIVADFPEPGVIVVHPPQPKESAHSILRPSFR